MEKVEGNWLPRQNLLSFLLILSRQILYDFGPVDWKAIQFGIRDSSVERNNWFSYILPGKIDIVLRLANEDGTGLISFKLEIPRDLKANFDFMIGMLQDFNVIPLSYDPSKE